MFARGTLLHRALERDDVEEVERVEDDEHRDDAEVAEAEAVGDEDRGLIAGETRKAPGGQHRAVDLRDVRHPVVVRQNRRNDGEARAVARVDDEKRKADRERPEAERHDADRDREDDEKDVDALREAVRPPREEEASASVHQPRKRHDRRDEPFRVTDRRGRHHLLRERDEAESAADVQEHEEPRTEEVRVLEQRPVVELQLGNAVSEALLLQLRLLEKKRRDVHGDGIEDREDDEDARNAVGLESAQVEHRDGRLRSPVNPLEENRRQGRAKSERNDRQRRRDRLVLVEPEHHRLHGRNVDDARTGPHQKTVTEVNEMQVLDVDADFGDDQSRNEERRPDQRREPDILLDDLPEERRAHSEEEDGERKRELHLRLRDGLLRRRDVGRDSVREIGEGINLPHRHRQEERRQNRTNESLHSAAIIQNIVPKNNLEHNISQTRALNLTIRALNRTVRVTTRTVAASATGADTPTALLQSPTALSPTS